MLLLPLLEQARCQLEIADIRGFLPDFWGSLSHAVTARGDRSRAQCMSETAFFRRFVSPCRKTPRGDNAVDEDRSGRRRSKAARLEFPRANASILREQSNRRRCDSSAGALFLRTLALAASRIHCDFCSKRSFIVIVATS
jgi:hypothetical protein